MVCDVMGCTEMYWDVLGCSVVCSVGLGCSGMFWDVLSDLLRCSRF